MSQLPFEPRCHSCIGIRLLHAFTTDNEAERNGIAVTYTDLSLCTSECEHAGSEAQRPVTPPGRAPPSSSALSPSRLPEQRLWSRPFVPYAPPPSSASLPRLVPQALCLSQVAHCATVYAHQIHVIEAYDDRSSPYFEEDSVPELATKIQAKLGECFERSSFKEILRCPNEILIRT